MDAKFKTFGCGSAIASSSLATEWVKGKYLDDAAKIKNSDIAKVRGVIICLFILLMDRVSVRCFLL